VKDNTSQLSGFMFPSIVGTWTAFAGFMVYSAVAQGTEITDQMISVLGILGGPALLIVNKVLESWSATTMARLEMQREEQRHCHHMAQGGMNDDEE